MARKFFRDRRGRFATRSGSSLLTGVLSSGAKTRSIVRNGVAIGDGSKPPGRFVSLNALKGGRV